MPLPHYNTMPTDPIYRNNFEFILITPTLIVMDQIYDQNINYVSEKNLDGSCSSFIDISFSFNESSFKDYNTKDYLNDIGYVYLSVYDSKGMIINRELIIVEFVSSNVNFNYTDGSLLGINIRLKNNGIENIDESTNLNVDAIRKKLLRNRKLDSLFV